MMMTRSVQSSVVPSSDQWHDDISSSSSSSSSSSLHVFRFSVEERHRLIAPSWFTSRHIEDYDDDGEDDDIVQEVLQQSVHEDFEFSNDDFISRAYEKPVSDFISNVAFLSNDDVEDVKFKFFRWVEMNNVFYLKVADVKIVVLIREETNGEGFTGDEFDGEFINIQDEDEDEEEAPPAQVEVDDQEVIQIEDDDEEEEEEVEVLPVVVEEEEEEEDDEARRLMETVFGSNDYMEVEELNYDVDDDLGGGGEGIEQRQEENNCIICMDALFSPPKQEVAEMPCSHEFHKSCIVEWLQLKNSCPLCRFEISVRNKLG